MTASQPADDWTPPEPYGRGEPVRVDARYGHITCGELVFCDMGSTLHAWSYSGDYIEPARARALGEALVAWADKKKPRDPRCAEGDHDYDHDKCYSCGAPNPAANGPGERACAHGVKPWKDCKRCFITEPTP